MTDIFFSCHGDSDQTPRDTMFNYDGDERPDSAELARAVNEHTAQHLGIDPGRVSTHFRHASGHKVVRVDGGEDEGVDRFAFQLACNPPKIREHRETPAVRISHPDARHYGAYGHLVDENPDADAYVVELLHGITEHYQRRHLASLHERNHFKTDDGTESTDQYWLTGDADAPYGLGEYAWHRTGDDPLDHTLVRVTARRYRGRQFRSYQGMVSLGWALTVESIRTGKSIEVGEDKLQKAPRDLQNLHIRRQAA